jgi:hypothetical protein
MRYVISFNLVLIVFPNKWRTFFHLGPEQIEYQWIAICIEDPIIKMQAPSKHAKQKQQQ